MAKTTQTAEKPEEFRQIKDCPKYEVSRGGIVRNIATKNHIARRVDKPGDVLIAYADGRRAQKTVEKLIADAFPPVVKEKRVRHPKAAKGPKMPKAKPVRVPAPKPAAGTKRTRKSKRPEKINWELTNQIRVTDGTPHQKAYNLIKHAKHTYVSAGEILGVTAGQISGYFFRTKNNEAATKEADAFFAKARIAQYDKSLFPLAVDAAAE